MEFLSDTELFYAPADQIQNEQIILKGNEFFHAFKVMRKNPSGNLFVTNGEGTIFHASIEIVRNNSAILRIVNQQNYRQELPNVYFCIPKLRNPNRFRFALEKCTELGIQHFIIFDSDYALTKSDKTDKWKSYLVAAMKQSLRAYLPIIKTGINIEQLASLAGEKILFNQKAENIFKNFELLKDKYYYFIFGPEGGFSDRETAEFEKNSFYKLNNYRLRSETAIIKCASLITD